MQLGSPDCLQKFRSLWPTTPTCNPPVRVEADTAIEVCEIIFLQDANLTSRRGLGDVICPYMEGTPNPVDRVITQLQICTYLYLFIEVPQKKKC